MNILTHETHGKHRDEASHEPLLRRQLELAKAALPLVANEAAEAPFIDVEDTLTRLTAEAEEMIQERGKPTRKLRRSLSRYAHRLLEITDQEPDLLDPRSISLVAHASDATGERDLLETTLEQAHRADLTSDTNVNLQAIEAALELDLPFSEIMRELNESVIPFLEEDTKNHEPLPAYYDNLFVRSGAPEFRRMPKLDVPVDEDGNPITVEQAFFKK